MKVKSVILDATLPTTNTSNASLWLYNNQHLIDWQIKKIQASGRAAIVAIGNDGDEILRLGKHLDLCDLVFTSDNITGSGLLAGLHGTGVCTFYLPVSVPYPPEAIWAELEKQHMQLPYNHTTHIIKPNFDIETYPWLITKLGRDTILTSGKFDPQDLGQRSVAIDPHLSSNFPTKTNG